jgi:hypothetical protein
MSVIIRLKERKHNGEYGGARPDADTAAINKLQEQGNVQTVYQETLEQNQTKASQKPREKKEEEEGKRGEKKRKKKT